MTMLMTIIQRVVMLITMIVVMPRTTVMLLRLVIIMIRIATIFMKLIWKTTRPIASRRTLKLAIEAYGKDCQWDRLWVN